MTITRKIMKEIRMGWILRMILAACGILLLMWLVLWAMRPAESLPEAILLSLVILACAAGIGLFIGLEQAGRARHRIRRMGNDLDRCTMVRAGDGLYYGETWMAWHYRESWLFWRRNRVDEIRIAGHNPAGNKAVITIVSGNGHDAETLRLNHTSMEVLCALQTWPAAE